MLGYVTHYARCSSSSYDPFKSARQTYEEFVTMFVESYQSSQGSRDSASGDAFLLFPCAALQNFPTGIYGSFQAVFYLAMNWRWKYSGED
ncbi:hypothetical protein VTP01DRAFT_7514, partial [Rhizomucor pusillus]|uniref:uncharacterized protein n=1 Tax=Rhizomucor pusillus TaxID=4840 RepID=UPI0037426751